MSKAKIENTSFKEAKKLIKYFDQIDPLIGIVLKAHLKIESILNEIIENFIFHPTFIKKARLGVTKKINIARSMSLTEANNTFWGVIILINDLRNDVAHNITPKRKIEFMEKLSNLMEIDISKKEWISLSDSEKLMLTTATCVGFLSSFLEEVKRFKKLIQKMDIIINSNKEI